MTGKGNFKNQFFEAGFVSGPGEFDFHGETAVYALEAADVNNDGFIDLLAGFARDSRIVIPKLHTNLSNYSLTAHIYFGKSEYPLYRIILMYFQQTILAKMQRHQPSLTFLIVHRIMRLLI
jgi:hypothetical protein